MSEPPSSPIKAALQQVALAARSGEAARAAVPTRPAPRPSAAVRLLSLFAAMYLGVALAVAAAAAWSASGYVAPLGAAAALGLFVLIARGSSLRLAAALGALGVIGQILWAVWIAPQPLGELAALWSQAQRVAARFDVAALYESGQPTAVALYGAVIWAFGDDLGPLRVASIAFWAAQTWLVWRIAQDIAECRGAAAVAVAAIALSPALIVFGPTPSAEAAFGALICAGVYAILSHRRRGLTRSAALAGFAFALAVFIRPAATGVFIAALLLLISVVFQARRWRPRLRLAGAALACALGFGVGAAGQAALSIAHDGRISVAPPAIGHQLMFGANRQTSGGFSARDLDRAREEAARDAETHTLSDRDRAARLIAWSRISGDPLGFAWFAATDKMARLWSSERPLLAWSREGPPEARARFEALGGTAVAGAVIDAGYLALLAAGLFGALTLLWRGGRVSDPSRWILIYGALAGLAVSHAFLDVRPRYHLAFTPFVAVLAAAAFAPSPTPRRHAQPGDDAAREIGARATGAV